MSTLGRTAACAIPRGGGSFGLAAGIFVLLVGCSCSPATGKNDAGTDASTPVVDAGHDAGPVVPLDGGDAGPIPDGGPCNGMTCGTNQTLNDTTCTCSCNAGFVQDLGNASNCVLPPCPDAGGHIADCDPNATCEPLAGGQHMCSCNTCYFGAGTLDAGGCSINNCCSVDAGTVSNQGPCPADTTCATSLASVTCTCDGDLLPWPPGTDDPTVECIANVCGSSGFCDSNALCQNSPDGGICTCNSPLIGSGKPGTCEQPNYCPGGNADAGQFCDLDAGVCSYSADGGSSCACISGFSGSGKPGECSPPDRCNPNPCDPHALCTNEFPSYTCACGFGYSGDGQPATPDGGHGDGGMHGCTPLDACSAATSPCPSGSTCTSTGPGTFTCSCATGSGSSCHIGYQSVATAGTTTCMTRTDGTLWCCGDNTQGDVPNGKVLPAPLGNDAGPNVGPGVLLDPTQSVNGSNWTGLAAGLAHFCALQIPPGATAGTLWCWGWNFYGQLGYDTYAPAVASGTITDEFNSTTPTQVGTASNWTYVAAGVADTCAINSTGQLWCWGTDNRGGSIGGTTVPDLMPNPDAGTAANANVTVSPPVQQQPGTAWSKVSLGNQHICGIRTDGTLWCWGSSNSAGQLGNGSTSTTPHSVTVQGCTAWSDIACGDDHTCAICNGVLWCWGDNNEADIGDGFNNAGMTGTVPVTTPTQPYPHTNEWASVSCAQEDDHVCATRVDGTVWCWGSDFYGQDGCAVSGIPNEDPETYQVAFTSGTSLSSVSVGGAYSCALDSSSKVWCWGENNDGQFCNGTQSTNSCEPGATE